MNKPAKLLCSAAVLLAIGSLAAPASAADEKALRRGEAATKRLMGNMDKDKDGKVTKEEFMKYMEAEFDRIDQNKDKTISSQEMDAWRNSMSYGD